MADLESAASAAAPASTETTATAAPAAEATQTATQETPTAEPAKAEPTEGDKEALGKALDAARQSATVPKGEEPAQLQGVEKALHDTKGTLTKAQQENAELKKRLAEYDAREAEAKKSAILKDAQAEVDDAVSVYGEDSPEARRARVLLASIEQGEKARVEAEAKAKELDAMAARRLFEASIAGKHPDASTIMADPAFVEWAMGGNPVLKAALMSDNAEDVNGLLDIYKMVNGAKARDAAKEQKRQEAGERAAATRGPDGKFQTQTETTYTREKIAELVRTGQFGAHKDAILKAQTAGQIR